MPDQIIPSQRVLNSINSLARRLFSLAEQREAAVQAHKAAEARYKARIAKFDTRLAPIKERLVGYMKEIGGTSFVALYASFHSKTENVQFKVTDAKSAVDLAKKLGIAALVTKDEVTVTHVVDAELLQAYLKAHPEHADEFAPYVQLPTIKMSRWAKPTTALTETFGTRLTNKSVSLTS